MVRCFCKYGNWMTFLPSPIRYFSELPKVSFRFRQLNYPLNSLILKMISDAIKNRRLYCYFNVFMYCHTDVFLVYNSASCVWFKQKVFFYINFMVQFYSWYLYLSILYINLTNHSKKIICIWNFFAF